ncbi:hypothetical protein [Sorangium sp. So ce176]|uniref:hypothetical protein n=1 Tax=Sorangium sp. So ce176 TaxID=3133286 RepID=UPI003F64158E
MIQRAPLAIGDPIKSVASIDVRVPEQQPTPWWAGEISLRPRHLRAARRAQTAS